MDDEIIKDPDENFISMYDGASGSLTPRVMADEFLESLPEDVNLRNGIKRDDILQFVMKTYDGVNKPLAGVNDIDAIVMELKAQNINIV